MLKFLFKNKDEFDVSMSKVKADLIKYINENISSEFYFLTKNSMPYHDIDFLKNCNNSINKYISELYKENRELKESIKSLELKLETILTILRVNK